MSPVRLWCPILLIALAGAACHPRSSATAPVRTMPAPAPATAAPTRPPAPPPPPPTVASPAAPLSEAERFRREALDQLNAEHPLGDAFFDYNQSALREDAKQALQQDARWLAKWPQTVIRVDGHCDERGTPEYNLALGEQRAEVAKEYLTSLGVRADRIQTRSFGKEAPFCGDSGESCWSQNRRDHFVITEK